MNPSALIILLSFLGPGAGPPADDAGGAAPEQPARAPAQEPVQEPAEKPPKYHFEFRLRVIGGARLISEEPAIGLDGEPVEQPTRKADLDLRQARLRFDAEYRGILKVRMSLEASGLLGTVKPGDVIRDAWANAEIRPGFQLKVGSFKRPYSRIELHGMSTLPVIERGLFNEYAVEDLGWGDRAVGFGMGGELDLRRPGVHEWTWALTVSNNALSDAPHGVDLHARLTWDPNTWLSLGASGAFKSVQDPLADESSCRSTWTREPECRRKVFGSGADVVIKTKALYLSVEANLAQDWRSVDNSPWMLGSVAYASYDFELGDDFRIQPVVLGEYIDTNLSFAENEAVRAVAGVNVLWKKRLRIMPQAAFVMPIAPVTAFNNFVESQIYGLWVAVQI